MKSHFNIALLIGIATVLFSCHSGPKPNLIFIYTDTFPVHDFETNDSSPHFINLRKFAKESTHFTSCFSTCPLNGPYQGMLLSGQHPLFNGCFTDGVPLNPERGQKFAEILTKSGYQTAHIGEWYLAGKTDTPIPSMQMRYGFKHTFEVYNSDQEVPDSICLFWNEHGKNRSNQSPIHTKKEHALQFIRSQKEKNEPFALFLSFHPKIGQTQKMDHAFGAIIETLKKNDLYKNSVIVFTAMRGASTGQTAEIQALKAKVKASRVPLFISYPHMAAKNNTNKLLLGTMDLMPSILELMEIKIPKALHGRNQAKAIRKNHSDAVYSIPLFSYAKNGYWGMVNKAYIYAFASKDSISEQNILYDRKKDPAQTTNLFNNKAYSSVKADLHLKTHLWMEYFEDVNFGYDEIIETKPLNEWETQAKKGKFERPIDKLKKLNGQRIMHFHGNNNYE